jgi:hypothetical protein
MYSRKFGLRLRGKFGNLRKASASRRSQHASRVCSPESTRRYRSSFLRDDLSAGSFGCGNDFLEALITAQTIPAQIEAQIAV